MRDYEQELKQRVAFIQFALKDAHCNGIVYGNSGGKDSALVGILCKLACENTVGVACLANPAGISAKIWKMPWLWQSSSTSKR